jgi:hypothetical protein
MTIPISIPVGPLAVTDPDTARAEALVATIIQVMKSGTSGGTASVATPPTVVPAGINPIIDPGTGLPQLSTLSLDTQQSQLWYRQFALAMSKVVPGWASGTGPTLGNLKFNEIPIGAVNGSNKVFTLSNAFIASSTRFYYNGQRLLLGTDYIEVPAPPGVTITTAFPAPRSGDNLVVDYVKP